MLPSKHFLLLLLTAQAILCLFVTSSFFARRTFSCKEEDEVPPFDLQLLQDTSPAAPESKDATSRTPRSPASTSRSPSLANPLVIVVCRGSRPPVDPKDDPVHRGVQFEWRRQEAQLRAFLASLLLFSASSAWRVAVVCDSTSSFRAVEAIVAPWPPAQRRRLLLERHKAWIPPEEEALKENWRTCAWTKEFLAEILPKEDAVVYADTDVVFLGPAEDLWGELGRLGPRQVVGLAQEGWYLMQQQYAAAGVVGVNTGVMLSNLTRQRALEGGSLGEAALRFSARKAPRGAHAHAHLRPTPKPRHDQDVMNGFLQWAPELLLEMSSRFNFLPSSCMEDATPCLECHSKGVLVLHGADATFFTDIEPFFKSVFEVIESYGRTLSEDPESLLRRLQQRLLQVEKDDGLHICGGYENMTQVVTKQLQMIVDGNKTKAPQARP